MARTPQQIGASNRRNGKHAQLDAAAWLRDHGYPHAAYEIRNGVSDILGTWDVGVEVTLTTWDKIWIKLDQAERDARRRGLDIWCVWKKRRGKTDPGEGAIVMPAKVFWPLMSDLEAYQRAEADFHLDWEKAFAAGFKAAKEGETRDTA
jgi:hypothetical protein